MRPGPTGTRPHPCGACRTAGCRSAGRPEVTASDESASAAFLPGHKPVAQLSDNEPPADARNAPLPPDAFPPPVGRPVTHRIHRDAAHPSRAVLPFITGAAEQEAQERPSTACLAVRDARTAKPEGEHRRPVAR
ncbi:hypothetical protein [Streptomyces sp. NPDC096105]|uniref:hypothetical protein n=1 Tax=Streptomyces sp. NPDC096105 TaxID=3366074 RepID=UPI0038261020